MAVTTIYKSESAAKTIATKRSKAEGIGYAPRQAGDGGWIVERVEPPVLQEQPAPEQPAATVASESNAFGELPAEHPADEVVEVKLVDHHVFLVGKLRDGATGEKWIDLRRVEGFDLERGTVRIAKTAAIKQKLVSA